MCVAEKTSQAAPEPPQGAATKCPWGTSAGFVRLQRTKPACDSLQPTQKSGRSHFLTVSDRTALLELPGLSFCFAALGCPPGGGDAAREFAVSASGCLFRKKSVQNMARPRCNFLGRAEIRDCPWGTGPGGQGRVRCIEMKGKESGYLWVAFWPCCQSRLNRCSLMKSTIRADRTDTPAKMM